MSDVSPAQIGALLESIDEQIPVPATAWKTPAGYPESLALCVIDAVQSIGVTYKSVVGVLDRYREYRRAHGGDPNRDGPAELIRTFAELGGAAGWAQRIGTGNRTSSHDGAPLKSEAIHACGEVLRDRDLAAPVDLITLAGDAAALSQLRRMWQAQPGQRSGISWRYMLMLAGVPGVKPDRMIRGFVSRALPGEPRQSDEQLVALLTEAAERLGVSVTTLDHALWRAQSGRDPLV